MANLLKAIKDNPLVIILSLFSLVCFYFALVSNCVPMECNKTLSYEKAETLPLNEHLKICYNNDFLYIFNLTNIQESGCNYMTEHSKDFNMLNEGRIDIEEGQIAKEILIDGKKYGFELESHNFKKINILYENCNFFKKIENKLSKTKPSC